MDDSELPPYVQYLLIIANGLNIFYNLPQIIHTYKTKSTKDFSVWFLLLRLIVNGLWVVYGAVINSALVIVNNAVNIAATIFLSYYKIIEMYNGRKNHEIQQTDKQLTISN